MKKVQKVKFWVGDIVKIPCGALAVVSQDSKNGEKISIDFLEDMDNFQWKEYYNSWWTNDKPENTLILIERGPAAKYREKLFGDKK